MQLTTELFFMFCWCVPWWECNMVRVDISSVMWVDQIRRRLDVRFFYTLYYTWLEVGVLTKQCRFVMTWYSFLGHKYSFFFNGIVCHLIALETLKSQIFFGLCLLKPHQGCAPDPIYNYDHWLFLITLNSIFFHKLTLVKVLG